MVELRSARPWMLLLVAGCSRTSLWVIPDDDDDCSSGACAGQNGNAGGKGLTGKGGTGSTGGTGGFAGGGTGQGGSSGVAGKAGASGSAGAPACAPGFTPCGTFCTDTLTDPVNCGFCNNICPGAFEGTPSALCRNGACVTECPLGLLACGQTCIDPFTDPQNCGFCGNVCASGLSCLDAGCACPFGESLCGGECVNTQTDERHCGECGEACGGSLECRDGKCLPFACTTDLYLETYFYPVAASENVVPLDLTNDGLMDLALVTDTSVVPFENFGNGAFKALTPIVLADFSDLLITAAAGDLNGDGYADLAVGHYFLGIVSVLLSTGDGSFKMPASYAAPGRSTAMAIADFDGDQVPDVAIHGSGLVSIHPNDGNGALLAYDTYSAGTANSLPSTSLTVGDFDADERPDIATTDSIGGTIALLRSANGSFSSTEYYQVGQWPAGIDSGDIDGDGDTDLIFSDTDSGLARVLDNVGMGHFAEANNYIGNLGMSSIALAELDGFPGPEVAALNSSDYLLYVFSGYGSPTTTLHSFAMYESPWIVVATDLDGDDRDDFAVVNGGLNAGLSVFLTRCPVPID